MVKQLQTKLMLLLAVVLGGVGSASATEAEVSLADGVYTGAVGSTPAFITWTIGDAITITQTSGTSGTAVNSSYISGPRVYKGHILSFVASEDYRIKKISITCDGSNYGNSMTAGTVLNGTTVTDNTTDVARTWNYTSNGTHVVSSVSDEGLPAIYIQNVASTTTNVQLRPTSIKVEYVEDARPSHNVTFSVNGTTTTVSVKEDNAIHFPEDPDGINGKVFMGWSESEINGTTDTKPTFVTTANMGTADMTFYAVFADRSENTAIGEKTLTITNTDFSNALTNSYGNKTISKTIDGNDYTIDLNACYQSNYCQMRDNSTLSYIHIPEMPGNITNVSTTACRNASNGTYTGTIHIKSAKTRGNSDTNDITKAEFLGAETFSIDIESECTSFYLLTSEGLRIKDLTVTYESNVTVVSYSDYCTTVPGDLSFTIGDSNWLSVAAPAFVSMPTGVTGYIVTSASKSGVKLTEIVAVTEDTPILLTADAGSYSFDEAEDGDLDYNDVELSANLLQESDGSVTGGSTIFALANGTNGVGFYKVASTVTIPAGKCYLEITDGQSRSFVGFDSEATAIEDVQEPGERRAQQVYDLQGRQLSNSELPKGLYIVNGKKVIIK